MYITIIETDVGFVNTSLILVHFIPFFGILINSYLIVIVRNNVYNSAKMQTNLHNFVFILFMRINFRINSM